MKQYQSFQFFFILSFLTLIVNISWSQNTCPSDDATEWEWLQAAYMNANSICDVFQVSQFTYNGEPHVAFASIPAIHPAGYVCAHEGYTRYFNCHGDLICTFYWPNQVCDNQDLLDAVGTGSEVIFDYSYDSCLYPFDLPIVSEFATSSCAAGIYRFQNEGNTYIYMDQTCEPLDGNDILYNCNTGIACYYGGLVGGLACDVAASTIINNLSLYLTNENRIWKSGDSIDCTEDPLQWPFIQDYINGQPSFCSEIEISSFTYEEEAHVKVTYIQGVDENGVDCPFEPLTLYYNCKGIIVCKEGFVPIEELCRNEPLINAGANATVIWSSVVPPVEGNDEIIFEEFPWVVEYTGIDDCIRGTVVTVYQSGIYSFIHIRYPDGTGDFFFQDGTFYCSDGPGRSCVELYQLGEPRLTWSCSDDNNPNDQIEISVTDFICYPDNTFSINVNATGASSGKYGIYGQSTSSEISCFSEGETFTYFGTGNTGDQYRLYIFDFNLADVGAKEFILEMNECEDRSFDHPLFMMYPWLTTAIGNSDCTSLVVSEYMTGPYTWISIEDDNGATLYTTAGELYCKDYPGFSCAEFYGLGNANDTWSCSN